MKFFTASLMAIAMAAGSETESSGTTNTVEKKTYGMCTETCTGASPDCIFKDNHTAIACPKKDSGDVNCSDGSTEKKCTEIVGCVFTAAVDGKATAKCKRNPKLENTECECAASSATRHHLTIAGLAMISLLTI